MSSRAAPSDRQQHQARGGADGKKDMWADNVHLKSHAETELDRRVQAHNAQISSDDKFIDYVHHIDNQNRQNLQDMLKEIQMLQASGASLKNSTRFQDLQFSVADQEAELEHRDFNTQAKSAIPNLRHSDFGFIGTQTCNKQKLIPKLFVNMLMLLGNKGKGEDEVPTSVQTDEQTCSDFVSLMEQIHNKKQEIRRDLHVREDFVPHGKAYKSSAFIGQKSQGGGYYPSTVNYDKTQSLMDFRNNVPTNARNSQLHQSTLSQGRFPSINSRTPFKSPKSIRSSSQLSNTFTPSRSLQSRSAMKSQTRVTEAAEEDNGRMRVSTLLHRHNQSKQCQILQNSANQTGLYQKFVMDLNTDDSQIHRNVLSHIPRHWCNFVQDALDDLSLVTNTVFEGQVIKGIRNGQGQMVYPNGDVYKGSYKNGERSGPGLCKFGQTGAIYKGEWRDDKPFGNGLLYTLPNEIIEARFDGYKITDGQVKILMSNHEFYEGNFKANKRHSTGIHYYANGDTYDGEWDQDRRIGPGRVHFDDGGKLNCPFSEDRAEGQAEFEDAFANQYKCEGQIKAGNQANKNKAGVEEPGHFYNARLYNMGTIIFKNQDKYKGSFRDGKPCGKGTLKYVASLTGTNGIVEEAQYDGHFKAGRRHGQGTITWQDGSSFTGNWRYDQRQEGEMRFQNGNIYRGTWVNDKLHGKGKLLMTSGIIFEGQFNAGMCDSVGKLMYPNGDIYFGQHNAFVKHGYGKMILANGSEYEGGWSNDRKNNQGRLYDKATGDVYNGTYQDGKKSGHGRLYCHAKREIYDGEFMNDRRQGEGYVINDQGIVCSGDFRADNMEGKLTYQKTLPGSETGKVFANMQQVNDVFISATKEKSKLSPLLPTRAQVTSRAFERLKRKTFRL